jgi:hypothetical protein
MVNEGRCNVNNNEMKCENDICKHADKVEIDHFWLRTKVYEGFDCLWKKKIIKANSQEDPIFVKECKVLNGFCRLANSIVVWHVDFPLFCPFYYIGKSEFFADRYSLISNDGKLAFQTVSAFVECDTKFFETSSGIFLSENIPKNLVSEKLKNELFISEETSYLNLADSDYSKYNSNKELRKIKWNNCLLYKMLLKSKMSKDNLMLLENRNEKMVIRFSNNNIFRVICNETKQITIMNSSKCFDKVSVSYEFESQSRSGFLGHQGLITNNASVADCSEMEEYYSIPNSSLTIIRNKAKVYLANANISWVNIDMFKDSEEVSLYHSKMLMEEIQKQEEVELDMSQVDGESMSHVQTIEEDSWLWSSGLKVWNHSLTRIAVAVFSVIIIYVIYKLILKICKKGNTPESKSSINETIQMNINIETKNPVRANQEKEEREKAVEKLWESLPSKQNNF